MRHKIGKFFSIHYYLTIFIQVMIYHGSRTTHNINTEDKTATAKRVLTIDYTHTHSHIYIYTHLYIIYRYKGKQVKYEIVL